MNLTPTERKIMDLLGDGERHTRQELRDVIDPYIEFTTVQAHVSNIRKKLPRGYNIVCVMWGGSIHYQYVRHVKNPYDGRS